MGGEGIRTVLDVAVPYLLEHLGPHRSVDFLVLQWADQQVALQAT